MKKRTWILYLLVGLVAIGEICWLYREEKGDGKEKKEIELTPAAMQKDIAYFFSTLKRAHPCVYQKYDSIAFVALEKNMKDACASPKSLLEFEYILLKAQRFLDGHTGFMVKELYKEMPDVLLPEVSFQPEGMFLGKDTLLQIGGISCSRLNLAVDSTVSWEFSRKLRNRKKNEMLNVLLKNWWKVSYPLSCVVGKRDGPRIDTLITDRPDSSCLYDYKGRRVSARCYQKPYDSAYFQSEKIAVLYYNTCDFRDNPQGQDALVKFIEAFFEKVDRYAIRTLFIDVSQNGGGNDVLHDFIFAHLNHRGANFEVYLTGKKASVEAYCRYVKKLLKEGDEWVETIGKPILEKGTADLPLHIPSQTNRFGGQVFILAGDKTFSAAFYFCALAKRLQYGYLVGEEIGQRFPLNGNILPYTLPNSQIVFGLPTTVHWETPALPLKEGYLQPDLPYSLEKPLGVEDFKGIIILAESLK